MFSEMIISPIERSTLPLLTVFELIILEAARPKLRSANKKNCLSIPRQANVVD